ncbi:cupin domain-containing protein [Burkholderia stagnalis]
MATARHQRPAELAGISTKDLADRFVARFRDRAPDWAAFADAKIDGFRRAQHRFIGAGGSGKHADQSVIPARGFTLSVMFVPPGEGNAAHTHEVEEVFFVLRGFLDVFLSDEDNNIEWRRLGPWECISCPPGVIHGYVNKSLEPVYFQVMLGRARPETMGYADDALFGDRDAHLASGRGDA